MTCLPRSISAKGFAVSTTSLPAPGADAASIEKSVWTYFSGKAEDRGIQLSELLTEVLKRDIEINEAAEVELLRE